MSSLVKVACPSCRSLFEIDASHAEGPGAPLCAACAAAGAAPPPPTSLRRSRPAMPEIDFGRRKRASQPDASPHVVPDDLDLGGGPGAQMIDGGFGHTGRPSSVIPGPLAARGKELSLSELASDVEPVSLRDLDVVLGPSTAPPAWQAAPAVPPPPPVIAEAAGPPSKPERAAEKPSFFRVDSIPPPSDEVPISVIDEAPAPPPSSGRADLESLLTPATNPPRGRAGLDLLLLDGGLFGGSAQNRAQPLAGLTPGTAAPPGPLAPVLSLDRVRASSRPPPPLEAPHAPKPAEPVPATPAQPPARRIGVVGWGAVLMAASALVGFAAARLSMPAAPAAPETTAVVAAPPPAATPGPMRPTATDAPAPVTAPPPAPTATEAPKPAETQAPAPKPADAAPRPADHPRQADPARPADPKPHERPAAPAQPAPAPPAPPPPAPAAGEFNRAAARTALASAAATAAGCKRPDDPSGGARVSVTFAPSGRVTSSKLMGSPFQGTPTGGCIARAFRGASVPPFSGDPVTITKDVTLH